jgi:hypothetical protein
MCILESLAQMSLFLQIMVRLFYTTAGTYKIRVVSKSAAIQTTEKSQDFVVTTIDQPTASAPTQPSRQAANVKSIFSAVYTDVAGSDYFPIGIKQLVYCSI